jgi:hypothetical protein
VYDSKAFSPSPALCCELLQPTPPTKMAMSTNIVIMAFAWFLKQIPLCIHQPRIFLKDPSSRATSLRLLWMFLPIKAFYQGPGQGKQPCTPKCTLLVLSAATPFLGTAERKDGNPRAVGALGGWPVRTDETPRLRPEQDSAATPSLTRRKESKRNKG